MPLSKEQLDKTLKYLDLVRLEFRQRVELKQSVINAYLVGLAAIAAFAIPIYGKDPKLLNVIWIVPLLCVAAATFYADHMLVSISLSNFIKQDMECVLNEFEPRIQFWDRAKAISAAAGIFNLLAFIEAVLLCLPVLAVTAIPWVLCLRGHRESWLGFPWEISLTAYGLACFGFSLYVSLKICA
jgi:hypothetical protein